MTRRVAVGLEYDGRAFAGWQSQPPPLRSVQSLTEAALAQVADHAIELVAAGRTDAGVHALAQVAHFDTPSRRSARAWMLGANSHLPADVSITWAREVPPHFHARYSVEARTYRYVICNRSARSALTAGRATLVHAPLDVERMRAAAVALLGEHDFSALRAAECQARSPVRRLTELGVERRGEWVLISATANAFLHHMVRNIAGLLIVIGQGKAPPAFAAEVLASRNRQLAPPTAPADGLYLWRVRYPAAFCLPEAEPPDGL